MARLTNTADRVDHLVEAAIHLIDTEGVEALTLRRLAAVMRLSPSTLVSHLGTRRRMIDLITKRAGSALVHEVTTRATRRGLGAVVPEDDLLPLVRAWLALRELARADDDLDAGAHWIDADLRHALGRIGRVPAGDELTRDVLAAVVTGIWAARCARTHPMSAPRGRAALHHACSALAVQVSPEPEAA